VNAAISAIVVSHNGAPWVERCLLSLRNSSVPVDVVVVDNASQDETLQTAARFSTVTLLPQDKNLGFGRANNVGIRLALERGANHVLLINQDAEVLPDTVASLVRCATANREYGILSPLHLDGAGRRLDPWFAEMMATDALDFYSDQYLGSLQPIYSVRFVNAAAWLISRDCLEKVGGFDPLYHMYEEDDDYCRRVWYHGFKIGIVPSAAALHSRGRNSPSYTSDWERRRSNLAEWSKRLRNRSILRLKDPREPFARQCAAVSIDFVRDVLQDLISFNLHGCAVVTLGFLSALLWLPRVWKHRRVSLRAGSHWL